MLRQVGAALRRGLWGRAASIVKRVKWSLRDPDDPAGMWRIGPVITITLIVALSIAAVVIVYAWTSFEPDFDQVEPRDFLQLVAIVLGVIAGGGGSVALVVAYRRQKIHERADKLQHRSEAREETRLFNERFRAASEQLGHDKAAVRLAGAHAMANLADDWDAQRQMCIDVLCSYLRNIGKEPHPDDPFNEAARKAWQSDREVRHTILHVIADHLRKRGRWTGYRFNLTGITIDTELDISYAQFSSGCILDLSAATFSGGDVLFLGAEFSDSEVSFLDAEFSGGAVLFHNAEFSGGNVWFDRAKFSGGSVLFSGTEFSGGDVSFLDAEFSGGIVSFLGVEFSGGIVSFTEAKFRRGDVSFDEAKFSGSSVSFYNAKFSGSDVSFMAVVWPGRAALDLPESAPGLEMPRDPDTPFDHRPPT